MANGFPLRSAMRGACRAIRSVFARRASRTTWPSEETRQEWLELQRIWSAINESPDRPFVRVLSVSTIATQVVEELQRRGLVLAASTAKDERGPE